MSFCHEETAEAVDGRAVGVGGGHVAPAQATGGQPRPTVGVEPGLFRGHSVDSANRRSVAILAGRVSFAFDLLASAQAVGRGRGLAACVAQPAGRAG
jgi:hypothetical protein